MRLTNDIKKAFISAVLADVPTVDYQEEFRKLVQAAAIETLPPEVKKLAKSNELRGYLDTHRLWWGPFNLVSVFADLEIKDMPELKTKCDELAALKEAQDSSIAALRNRLTAAVGSCNTRKQLAELLPEMEKYLPEDPGPTKNLPAVANLVTDLMKQGWPKDSKQPE